MGRLGVNLTDVNIEGMASYPAGIYTVQVGAMKPGVSKKGNAFNQFPLRILQHPEFAGKLMYYDCYDAAPWTLKRLAQACEALLPDGDVEGDMITGKTISVEVKVITHHPQTGEELKKPWNEIEVIL